MEWKIQSSALGIALSVSFAGTRATLNKSSILQPPAGRGMRARRLSGKGPVVRLYDGALNDGNLIGGNETNKTYGEQ